MLQEYSGELNFGTDCWTSPNHKAMVAFTVHLEHNGVPLRFVLDIVEVARSHSGAHLAAVFAQMLEEFGIMLKTLSVTADNASANDLMVDELEELVASFRGQTSRARCFDHIINLVAKTLLRQFDLPKAKLNTQDDDGGTADAIDHLLQELVNDLDIEEDDAEQDGSEADNLEGWEDERAQLSPEDRDTLDACVRPVKLVLVKLRKLSSAIIHSSTKLLPAWERIVAALELASKHMPRDVATRWNSTYTMLCFAIEYRQAVDELTSDRAMGMRKYELSEEEWLVAGQLRDVLRIFYDATQYFSRGTPSLPMVIPAMDIIDEKLTNQSLDLSLRPSVRAAIKLAKKTLNKYYSLTDDASIYRIAMILHPSYKLDYFGDLNWEQDWILQAKNLVRVEFDRHVAARPPVTIIDSDSDATESQSKNMFDTLISKKITKPSRRHDERDELMRYLDAKTEPVDNPLTWWHTRRAEYPILSCMALSYLTIPATSVDVERLFSKGRVLLPHLRNGLSGQSIRVLLCLSDWSRLGLILDKDILAVTSQPEGEPGDEGLESGWDKIVMPDSD